MKCRSRLGFTLIELLVVIAIVALLLGLLLAGVQKARMAAAQAQCLNQIKQIGIALHGYHQDFGYFPPGMTTPGYGDSLDYISWQARILPYLEQSSLWDQALREYAAGPPFGTSTLSPHATLSVFVPAFVCPLDPQANRLGNWFGQAVAFTSYLGVEGVDFTRSDGILFGDSHIRFADVTDGTSNTLLVGERPPSTDSAFGWWYAGTGQNGTGSVDMDLGVRELNFAVQRPDCPTGPFHYQVGTAGNPCDDFHFWSFHPNGAHFLFADGSGRFLPYSADPVMPALATRAGGEAVEAPF